MIINWPQNHSTVSSSFQIDKKLVKTSNMGFKVIMILLSVLILASSTSSTNARRELLSEGAEFDVTNSKYGGKADSDIAQVMISIKHN